MIKGELLGSEELKLRASRWAPSLRGNVGQAIGRLVLTLMRNVKADKLSGQVLNVKTGRLRRSINAKTTDLAGDHPSGSVGTNVVYARPHEYGFDGTVNVKSHVRNIKQAFGRSITPVAVTVNGYARKVHIPEHSFLRSALAELEPTIQSEINSAVKEAIK